MPPRPPHRCPAGWPGEVVGHVHRGPGTASVRIARYRIEAVQVCVAGEPQHPCCPPTGEGGLHPFDDPPCSRYAAGPTEAPAHRRRCAPVRPLHSQKLPSVASTAARVPRGHSWGIGRRCGSESADVQDIRPGPGVEHADEVPAGYRDQPVGAGPLHPIHAAVQHGSKRSMRGRRSARHSPSSLIHNSPLRSRKVQLRSAGPPSGWGPRRDQGHAFLPVSNRHNTVAPEPHPVLVIDMQPIGLEPGSIGVVPPDTGCGRPGWPCRTRR